MMHPFKTDRTPGESTELPAVDITTEVEGRYRRIKAAIAVPGSLEQVWHLLTDYDCLSDFIPNLTLSRRIPHPEQGIRLEQIGSQCFLNIKFCARVVLDMVEQFPHRLDFTMVEGDFKDFEGFWSLETLETPEGPMTQLGYELMLRPPRAVPATLIERHLRRDLTQNLQAICQQATVAFAPV
ncbi:MAG: SRPBCC family protein [Cyanobacteria bacterium]|nr:SRPBCC family protein [Cyanobacteriota bacterium]MDA0866552.1 SRPBCC family protein [Cyanobacteriota bacterium]